MADYTRHTETITQAVYTLSSPTNWAEVQKVLVALQNDPLVGVSDDAVRVEANDDEIRFVASGQAVRNV